MSVGSFLEDGGERSGLEISAMANVSNSFSGRFSGVLYVGRNNDEIKDLFGGFSFSGYYHLNFKYINPYLGAGVFFGDTYHCTDKEKEDEGCQEDLVAAIYPEIGVAFNLGELHIYPFVRRYNFGEENTYGLNLGLVY